MHTLTQQTTITGILQYRARTNPNKIVYTFLENGEDIEKSMTFSQLNKEAIKIAGYLQKVCNKGDRVLLLYPQGLEFIKAFFGCLYAGVVAVPAFPPRMNRNLDRLHAILNDADVQIILSTSDSLKLKNIKILTQIEEYNLFPTDTIEEKYISSYKDPEINNDDIAFLQYTSGSTGTPKGVIVTHNNIIHNENLIRKAFHRDENSLIVSWLPFYHDMGLIGNIIFPVYMGSKCILMSPVHFLQKPVRWLNAISKYKADSSGGPNFAYDLCVDRISDKDLKTLKLESWITAFNGAEPVRASTLRCFADRFKNCGFKEEAFQPCYGMAETTLLVTAHDYNKKVITKKIPLSKLQLNEYNHENNVSEIEIVSCGKTSGFDIAIIDQSGNRLKEGQVGEIVLKGESVAKGYWNKPVDTNNTFKVKVRNKEGEYLKTGDLGLIINGNLYITGRLKDIIIINGTNYYPGDIEKVTVNSNSKLINESCAALSVNNELNEQLIIICEVNFTKKTDFNTIYNDIKKAVFEEYNLDIGRIVLLRKGTIPKTTSGKIQRQKCKKDLLSNDLHIIHEYPDNKENKEEKRTLSKTEEKITDLVNEILDVKITDPETSILTIGFDSIKVTQFALMASEVFSTYISIDTLFEFSKIKDIANYIDNSSKTDILKIARSEQKEYYKVTAIQKGIWFDLQIDPENSGYNIPLLFKLDGRPDTDSLEKSINILIRKYEILRTSFHAINGNPVQKIHDNLNYKLIKKSFIHLESESRKEEIKRFTNDEAKKSFDLTKAPLFRAFLIIKDKDYYSLFFVIHHLIIDGYSISIIFKELFEIYERLKLNEKPDILIPELQYKDYSEWTNTKGYINEIEKHKEYWMKQLSGRLPKMKIPYDFSKNSNINNIGGSERIILSPDIQNKINQIAKEYECSVYNVLLTCFVILIHRISNENDIVIGAPVINRDEHGLTDIPGLFLNTVMLRNFVNPAEPFYKLLENVKTNLISALKHKAYPFNKIVEALKIELKEREFPISSIFFNGLNFTDYSSDKLHIDDIFLSDTELGLNFDLNCYLAFSDKGISIRLDYRKSLFLADTVRLFLLKFRQIIENVCNNTSISIKNISAGNKAIINCIENEYAIWYDKNFSITNVFYNQSDLYSSNIAVKSDNCSISYKDLNEITNKWARFLNRRIGKRRPIGIYVNHNENIAISVLSILKSGNYYVPISKKYPVSRINEIIEDIKISAIITDSDNKNLINTSVNTDFIAIDDNGQVLKESRENPDIDIKPDSIAYILYTSGTTGKPKGVIQTHENVLHFISSYSKAIDINMRDRLTGFSAITFDSFTIEFYGALLNGAIYHPYNIEEKPNQEDVYTWLDENKISIWQSIPTVFTNYALEWIQKNRFLKSLRIVKMTGEAVHINNFEHFKKLTKHTAKLAVSLGSTESSLSTINLYNHHDEITKSVIPVGFPVNETQIVICNKENAPVDIQEIGEILVQSDFITKGYHNNKQINKDTFIYINNSRYYKTGDIGRVIAGGRIEWLGRKDLQVKMNGIRIELEDIEQKIIEHKTVKDAVVIVKNKNSENSRLSAYIECEEQATVSEIETFLKELLPEYMIPNEFIKVDKLPRLANNKKDRNALENIKGEIISDSKKYISPTNSTEVLLQTIFQDVLRQEKISVHENFFSVGGNSMKAVQIASKAKDNGLNIQIKDIFRFKTISELVKNLKNADKEENQEKDNYNKEIYELLNKKYNSKSDDNKNESKELELTIQNEVTSYLDYALILSIVFSEEKIMPWYYGQFIDIQTTDIQDESERYNGETLFIRYLENDSLFSDILEKTDLGIKMLEDIPNMIDYTIHNLNNNYYLVVNIDEYYLPDKKSYKTEHYVHASLIYGYNNKEKEFLVLGFDDNEMITKMRFSYEQYLLAWESAKKHYKKWTPYFERNALFLIKKKEYPYTYKFDLNWFLKKLHDYIYSIPDNSKTYPPVYNNNNQRKFLHNGFDAYSDIIRHLNNLISGRLTMDYRVLHMLAEHKRGLLTRFRYIQKYYGFNSEAYNNLIDKYGKIVYIYEEIRINGLNAQLSFEGDYKAAVSTIKKIRDHIISNINSEKEIVYEIYQFLQSKDRPVIDR